MSALHPVERGVSIATVQPAHDAGRRPARKVGRSPATRRPRRAGSGLVASPMSSSAAVRCARVPAKLGYVLDREETRERRARGHTGRGLIWSTTRRGWPSTATG